MRNNRRGNQQPFNSRLFFRRITREPDENGNVTVWAEMFRVMLDELNDPVLPHITTFPVIIGGVITMTFTYILTPRRFLPLIPPENRQPQQPLNPQTFLWQTNVNEIQPENQLFLDGYMFDVEELVTLAQKNLAQLFINPHTAPNNQPFSSQAIETMRARHELREYVNQLDTQLQEQSNSIDNTTIESVHTMLLSLAENRGKHSETAIQPFHDFYNDRNKLPLEKRMQLDRYIIKVPTTVGGTQNKTFGGVIKGMAQPNTCIVNTQAFLWQFLQDLRPDLTPPQPVIEQAERAGLNIRSQPQNRQRL